MSNYNQNQAYPPPATAYPTEPQGGFMAQPPPAGYPMKDGQQDHGQAPAVTTQSRGDGFWKGCCAALCCCCVLDACF
ncbi:Protein CYSTEINE-RICH TRANSMEMBRANE MODULE 9 [Castilleja foliolosa]|uniref:Protein CYSTEINE-RICH TRANSMEMBRANE MODULE 9 n=1 Tax=Castilleja foliolosa TaxID=1961234 RepID=A0ABD3DZD6_9LAMI